MFEDRILEIGPGPLPQVSAREVGNKAWNLMCMASAGLNVPSGFVLPASWCKQRSQDTLTHALAEGIARLEKRTGLMFGSARKPLLVSVRSGSAVSMPGMLETVLDIGLTPDSVEGMLRLTGNPRLAWDSYRRLIQGYAEVVQGLAAGPFDQLIEQAVAEAGAESDRELDYRSLRRLARDMMERFHELAREPFPTDAWEQLHRAADAVYRSWDAPKAVTYRRLNQIGDDVGTAVTVQTMVFGNAGGQSGSGVGFTRNPATGEPEIYLDFRFNAQGEDVVAGRHTSDDQSRLRATLPAVWEQIEATCRTIETLFRDAQDFEFTLQKGALYLLQSRDAKRTDWAALRIAVDLVNEGLIDPVEAHLRLRTIDVERISRTRFEAGGLQPLARAEAASIGVAGGVVALDSETAERLSKEGKPVILVRRDIATADISGIASAAGILTASGSRTSHAAVVARQLGKVCLVGCSALSVDAAGRLCRIGTQEIQEGDYLSLDGNQGLVYAGKLKVLTERPLKELRASRKWTPASHASHG